MNKLLVGAMTIVLALVTTSASATSVTRDGKDYSGIRNPNNCEIFVEHGDLHVKCTSGVGATGAAYIRYRFLSDVGAIRDNAKVTAFIDQFIGQGCSVEWMVRKPHTPARTARVTVPKGNYCHIRSVTWSQR